jgi:hypothetical protein
MIIDLLEASYIDVFLLQNLIMTYEVPCDMAMIRLTNSQH